MARDEAAPLGMPDDPDPATPPETPADGTEDGSVAPEGIHAAGWWPMATLDRDGRTIDVNEPMAELLGRTRADLLGQIVTDVIDFGAIGPEREAYERLLAGEPLVRYPRKVRFADGTEWSGEAQLSLARDADDQPELIHVRLFEEGARRPPPRIAGREGDIALTLDRDPGGDRRRRARRTAPPGQPGALHDHRPHRGRAAGAATSSRSRTPTIARSTSSSAPGPGWASSTATPSRSGSCARTARSSGCGRR